MELEDILFNDNLAQFYKSYHLSKENQEKRKKERQGQRLHRSSRNPIHANERQDKLFSRCL